MRLMRRAGWAILAGWLWFTLVPNLPGLALDVPPLSGRVVDLAHVLPPATTAQLSETLQAHETKTSNQVAVLIVPSLEDEPLFDFSHRVATTWKLGAKGIDNGVLLLIAIKERKIRLEVGYGLEGVLTDARSAQIIRHETAPKFRAGDVPAGVTAGVLAVLHTIEGTYKAPEQPTAVHSDGEVITSTIFAVILGLVIGLFFSRAHRVVGPVVGGGLSFLVAPWVIPALIAGAVSLVLVSLMGGGMGHAIGGGRRGRSGSFDDTWFSTRHGGWGSGGLGESFGGSGGFSGGGGDFGGGGASGDW